MAGHQRPRRLCLRHVARGTDAALSRPFRPEPVRAERPLRGRAAARRLHRHGRPLGKPRRCRIPRRPRAGRGRTGAARIPPRRHDAGVGVRSGWQRGRALHRDAAWAQRRLRALAFAGRPGMSTAAARFRRRAPAGCAVDAGGTIAVRARGRTGWRHVDAAAVVRRVGAAAGAARSRAVRARAEHRARRAVPHRTRARSRSRRAHAQPRLLDVAARARCAGGVLREHRRRSAGARAATRCSRQNTTGCRSCCSAPASRATTRSKRAS